jgi:hypothetical protein
MTVAPDVDGTPRIVEPVIRCWTFTAGGHTTSTDTTFTDIAEARQDGLKLACLNGTTAVTIVGADEAVLREYDRTDNLWHDRCRGRLTVDQTGTRTCSCGGVPTVAIDKPMQHERTMGWHWGCDRCGAWSWLHVEPDVTGR